MTKQQQEILNLIDKYCEDICFGRIGLEIAIQNNKMVMVEVSHIKETKKLN